MPEDISMLIFITNNFSVIEKELYWFLGKNGITCNNIHIKTVYIHMNWPYSYLKCCLRSHFLRLTINWKIYIFAKEFKMVKVCMMPSYLFPSGKYMQMMTVLKPIAFDVILCMSQLFDYYFYTVSWNLYLHVLVYTGKAVLYIFFLSGINFFYLISGVFLFRCWYSEYEIQNLWHIYIQINSRQFKWKGPSKYCNIWYGKVSLISEQEKNPLFSCVHFMQGEECWE